jgi:glycosyltransferase involved in cell wall biosynthesis
MKISFLIPSKNRLGLLKHAVTSILDQADTEIEIIIADNASSDDYKSYVNELDDERVVYYRQPKPVSVTENWRSALSLATGDYFLMLGDDDALAPSFLSTVRQYLPDSGPDLLYVAAYHYCYPNVLPGNSAGYLASVLNSEFFANKQRPFSLDRNYARDLVQSVLEFHHRFGLNAQHFLLKTSFVRQFSAVGGIYQSPYPDTFSAIAAFAHAQSILVLPTELVLIGISPKSFGAFYFSDRHDEGYRFLDNEQVDPAVRASLRHVILPGDRNNTNWLVAAESARRAFPSIALAQSNFQRYRMLQMIDALRRTYLQGSEGARNDLRIRLSESERLLFDSLETALQVLQKSDPGALTQAFEAIAGQLRQYEPATVSPVDIGPHGNILDAYHWLKKNDDNRAERAISRAQ